MALSKKQKAERAQRQLEEARAQFEAAQVAAIEAGVAVSAPALGIETKTTSQTVWVGCKLPRGLTLNLFIETKVPRRMADGNTRDVVVYMRDPSQEVRLKGYAIPVGKVPNYPIIGDFGLTEVPRAFWEKWVEQNKGFDAYKNGLIFAHGEKASVEAYANEKASMMCGLEPLMKEGKDPRTKDLQPDSENLSEIAEDTDRGPKKSAA